MYQSDEIVTSTRKDSIILLSKKQNYSYLAIESHDSLEEDKKGEG